MKKILFALLLVSYIGFSQNSNTSYEMIENSESQYKIDLKKSIVKNIDFTNIGPSVMSGRVTDLEVNPKNTTEFYVAYASGGLWHTKNNGNTFEPIFDNADTQNIGDFDVNWESNVSSYSVVVEESDLNEKYHFTQNFNFTRKIKNF